MTRVIARIFTDVPWKRAAIEAIVRAKNAEYERDERLRQELEMLTRRLAYGGRKGRRAARRLAALVTTSAKDPP